MEVSQETIDGFFKAISKDSGIKLNKSPLPLMIKDEEGTFEGHYAFYQTGAIRVEVSGNEIIGVAVWTKPDDLNTPTYHCKLKDIDAFGEIDTIIKLMKGSKSLFGGEAVFESKMYEDTVKEIEEFMNTIGGYAYDKKLSDLYQSYEQWAEINSKKRLSNARFFALAKEWLIKNKKGKYADFEITKGNKEEETEINGGQEEEFEKEVMENEIYHKAALLEHAIRRMAQNDPIINSLFLCGAPGMGKAQPLSSKIMTPNGWVKMGDIKIGTKIFTPSGGISTVIDIFPQGIQDIYEITLRDGSKTRTTKDHLFKIKIHGSKSEEIVVPLKFFFDKELNTKEGGKFLLSLCSPLPFSKKELSIDPYALGLLIGDGGLTSRTPIFSSMDQELVISLEETLKISVDPNIKLIPTTPNGISYRITSGKFKTKKLFENIYTRSPIRTTLETLKLYGKDSYNKFIPSAYLYSSIEDRIRLLQGLMDTDGYPNKTGSANIYTTSSKQLAEDVFFLVKSLGGLCYRSKKIPKYSYKGQKLISKYVSYNLYIRIPKSVGELYSLTRKKERYNSQKRQEAHRSSIISIDYVGKEEAQCILIDNPEHLYVTDDFIITHNTTSVKRVLQNEGVWDEKVVWKAGTIAGFTGLLQVLWENRKNKILVLDDCDNLLIKKDQSVLNIFKAAMNTEQEDRTISYVRKRRR
jgi:hypothetical protein